MVLGPRLHACTYAVLQATTVNKLATQTILKVLSRQKAAGMKCEVYHLRFGGVTTNYTKVTDNNC